MYIGLYDKHQLSNKKRIHKIVFPSKKPSRETP